MTIASCFGGVLLCGVCCMGAAHADVLKCWQDGQVVYTNTALKQPGAQCTTLFPDVEEPVVPKASTVSLPKRKNVTNVATATKADAGFNLVSGQVIEQGVQRARDDKRRQILLEELHQEEQKLSDARRGRDRAAELGLSGLERVRAMAEQLTTHERNVLDLRRELGLTVSASAQ